ncbi:hypothetical protein EG68_10818 [Paragonimus skrjabini miyazakii]|uniref:Uncharacterized protein n=1 Tax=Paragonimus skrjabini miyazakii TaxID=59628 RepID=A0A8S9YEN5_9TREM|nr:hypothetical protein EG68_10818 [Paragonimus skrjabini miyazakii]
MAHWLAHNRPIARTATSHSGGNGHPNENLTVITVQSMENERTGVAITEASETQEWAQMQSDDPDLHPIYQRLLQGQRRPTKQEVAETSWEHTLSNEVSSKFGSVSTSSDGCELKLAQIRIQQLELQLA